MVKAVKDAKIVLIGSGNLATNLGKAMKKSGLNIVQIYSQTAEHAKELAKTIDCDYTNDISNLLDADIYISALKDDIVTSVWQQIDFKNKLLLHTAGSLPMQVLAPHTENYGVLYPLMTFSKNKEVDFEQIPVFIEANNADNLSIVEALAQSVSGKVYHEDSKAREQLHLAAVFVNNFSNYMYAKGEELLQKSGIPFEALLPLIDETAEKVHQMSPSEAQTGPAKRYDKNIIAKHKSMLNEKDAELYDLISKGIHEMTLKQTKQSK